MSKWHAVVLWSCITPFIAPVARGADDAPAPASQAPIDARYEVVRGTPAGTVRLDRYTGQVVREFRDVTGLFSYWEETEYVDPPSSGNTPRYQVLLDGRGMLLVDTESGKVWRWEPENQFSPSNYRFLWKPFDTTIRAPFSERPRR